jgi:hypothetical protein
MLKNKIKSKSLKIILSKRGKITKRELAIYIYGGDNMKIVMCFPLISA